MAAKKPAYCFNSCPLAKKCTGFVPDRWQGPRSSIKMAILLEAPGSSEIMHQDPTDQWGAPLVGNTGKFFDYSILHALGIPRRWLLICNTLRCRPQGNQYPVGKHRVEGELACRHWDDKLIDFDPDWIISTYHPSAVFQKPQYIEFIKRSMKFAWNAQKEGHRPLVTMGLKAMNITRPWLKGGLKKWQRYYEPWSYSSSVVLPSGSQQSTLKASIT